MVKKSSERGSAVVILLFAVALVAASVLGTTYLINNQSSLGNLFNKSAAPLVTPTPAKIAPAKEVRLQGVLALKEGSIGIKTAPGVYKEIKKGDTVKEGDVVKTGYKSRGVIELDDGSAVRIDQNSEISLTSLGGELIVLDQYKGRIYHRVHPGRLKYTVKSLGSTATALGTSFSVTTNSEQKKTEIAVFESKVALTGEEVGTTQVEIDKGQVATVDQDNKVQLSEIAPNTKKEEFIAWNQTLDQAPTPTSKPTSTPAPTNTPVPTVKQEENKAPSATPVTSASSAVTATAEARSGGALIKWTGDSPNGFKVCYSEAVNPSYPNNNCTYKNATERSLEIGNLTGGKTYHFRVGIYGWDNKVSSYSNDVTVTPTGSTSSSTSNSSSSLTLTATSNETGKVTMNWTLSGDAINGFKVVWAEHENPTYPEDHWDYDPNTSARSYDRWSGLQSGKTLHFRVGVYKSGQGVTTYSNDVTVTVK